MATTTGAKLSSQGPEAHLTARVEKSDAPVGEDVAAYTGPRMRLMHDPSVSFDEYAHYAALCRAEEENSRANEPKTTLLELLWPKKNNKGIGLDDATRASTHIGMDSDYKAGTLEADSDSERKPWQVLGAERYDITDNEWLNAQRALRTASGAACFYLITTDILGPFGLPYAFALTGWGPGITLFTIFAVLAGYSGYLLNRMFMGTDSYQYPTRSYGDLGYKIYGQWARIPINLLQGVQLIAQVAIICISNGQALSVITKFKFCYVGCIAVLAAAGAVIGQIRTLQKFGWIANVAVFFNVFIMIFTMAVAATSGPNYLGTGLSAGEALGPDLGLVKEVNGKFPPVMHTGGLPVTGNFIGALNGITNAIYAYGGANIFNEFMAEMRRPKDFLHAMWAAQFFIWFVYMFYGLFLYGYQGQYSINPSPQTVSPYYALVVANIMYILSAGFAAALYGNIGLKVLYNNVFVEIFRAPSLQKKSGKICWVILIPVYWALAFVIGSSIPNFGAFVGVVGSICIIQFTYSFPPLLYIGYRLKINAALPGEGYDVATDNVVRHDAGFKRIVRGFTGGNLKEKAMMAWNVVYMLGALAMGGLGAFASITIIIEAFAEGGANAFTCVSPLNGTLLG